MVTKLKCFLCGSRYNPEKREPVVYLLEAGNEEPVGIKQVGFGDRVLKLCPACVKAFTLGSYFTQLGNENSFLWTEDIEYEEDAQSDME